MAQCLSSGIRKRVTTFGNGLHAADSPEGHWSRALKNVLLQSCDGFLSLVAFLSVMKKIIVKGVLKSLAQFTPLGNIAIKPGKPLCSCDPLKVSILRLTGTPGSNLSHLPWFARLFVNRFALAKSRNFPPSYLVDAGLSSASTNPISQHEMSSYAFIGTSVLWVWREREEVRCDDVWSQGTACKTADDSDWIRLFVISFVIRASVCRRAPLFKYLHLGLQVAAKQSARYFSDH